MALSAHLEQLNSKHANLDTQIQDEMRSPMPDHLRLSELKKQKLQIKELADTDADGGYRAGEELAAGSERAVFIECDVSDKLDVHNLIAESLGSFGRIDGLVNNAGIAVKGCIFSVSSRSQTYGQRD